MSVILEMLIFSFSFLLSTCNFSDSNLLLSTNTFLLVIGFLTKPAVACSYVVMPFDILQR